MRINNKNIRHHFYALTLLLIFSSTTIDLIAQPPASDYQLVFTDEFEGTEIKSDHWWTIHCWDNKHDFTNADNAFTDGNGLLVLTGEEETITCDDITRDAQGQ